MTLSASLALGATTSSGPSRTSTPPAPLKALRTASSSAATAPSALSSVRHQVLKGENLYRISLAYGVTVEALCRANGIKDEGVVTEGQVLFVPVTRTARPEPTPSTPPATMTTALSFSRDSGPQVIKSAPKILISNQDGHELLESRGAPDADTEGSLTGEGSSKGISYTVIPSGEPFSWPVQGGIVRSPFGMRRGRQHAGIDISAPTGSPIYAARDGVVSYSGHKFQGYGNVVMIDHGDGFTTVYAHNVVNLVRGGDAVVRGQMIARVGATGNATGAHCHFEVRNDSVSVDPRGYLCENPDDDIIFANGIASRLSPGQRQAVMPQQDLLP